MQKLNFLSSRGRATAFYGKMHGGRTTAAAAAAVAATAPSRGRYRRSGCEHGQVCCAIARCRRCNGCLPRRGAWRERVRAPARRRDGRRAGGGGQRLGVQMLRWRRRHVRTHRAIAERRLRRLSRRRRCLHGRLFLLLRLLPRLLHLQPHLRVARVG